MRLRSWLWVGVCATLWTDARDPLLAQSVHGVLIGSTPPEPLAGVVITAARTRDGEVVARAVTSASGRFTITVGVDSVIVRALRIGQRPVTLFRGRLAPGSDRDVGGTLPDEPVAIASLRVRERARCGAVSPDSSVVSALFADALTALAASVGTMEGSAPVMHSLRVDEERDRRDRLLTVSAPVLREGTTTQAFRSVPVPLLLREGFVVRDADAGSTFRAPDAVVLTDDRFLARTCLSLDRSREDEGRIGIRFAPTRQSETRVDVQGVLWLDAATRALETLEFGYVGLTSISASVNPGGTIEYMQLPDGRWIIERWTLRMPRLEAVTVSVPGGRGTFQRVQASGTTVVRGLVTQVHMDDQVLYSVGGVPGDEALQRSLALGRDIARPVRPEVPADSQMLIAGVSTASLARVRACVARAESASPNGVALVVRVVDAMGRARAAMPVEAAWRTRYLRVGDAAWAWETDQVRAETDEAGEAVLCELPRADRVQVRALVSGCAPVRATLRPAAGAVVNEIRLRLSRDCGR